MNEDGSVALARLLPYDPNLCENLPIFDEPITNFSKVVIDPDEDPLVRFFSMSLPKGERSKRHTEMLQRMQADQERIAQSSTSHWQRLKQVALSRFKQKEIISKAVDKIEHEQIKNLKYSNAPGFIAHKSKIKKLIELSQKGSS